MIGTVPGVKLWFCSVHFLPPPLLDILVELVYARHYALAICAGWEREKEEGKVNIYSRWSTQLEIKASISQILHHHKIEHIMLTISNSLHSPPLNPQYNHNYHPTMAME